MSKKTTTKSKSKAPVKAKSKPAPKKKPVKKAAPAAKKKVTKPAPKAKAKVKAKAPVKAKPVAKKPLAKKPTAKKVVAKKPEVKKAPSVEVKKPVAKKITPPVKVEDTKPVTKPLSKPATKSKSSSTMNRTMEIYKPVIRQMPVNRRPEPVIKPREDDQPGKTRYSDVELEEFRAIINSKLEDARKELFLLQAQMTASNDHGTDDTASTFKILEDGSDSLAKEEAGQLAGRQKKFIEQLENAMVRIENKTYGVCRVSGKLIPKERLRAVPHTTQTIEAKLKQYRD